MTRLDLSPLEALQLTIIGEARGEPIEGQIAVGWIIKNRLLHNPSKYKNYKDVCFEIHQFSCWNDDSVEKEFLDDLVSKLIANNNITDIHLEQCMFVGQSIDENKIIDNTKGALYYLTNELYNSELRPKWAKNPKNVVIKGTQSFFNV